MTSAELHRLCMQRCARAGAHAPEGPHTVALCLDSTKAVRHRALRNGVGSADRRFRCSLALILAVTSALFSRPSRPPTRPLVLSPVLSLSLVPARFFWLHSARSAGRHCCCVSTYLTAAARLGSLISIIGAAIVATRTVTSITHTLCCDDQSAAVQGS